MPACTTTIDAVLSNQASFDGWKASKDTSLNLLANSTQARANPPAPTTAQQADLLELDKEITNTIACMHEKLTAASQATNDIQTAQTQLLDLQDSITNAEEAAQIAKDRVALIRDPESRPSYYEGWFKLMDRPMKPTSIPIFIGIVVFFTALTVLLLLRLIGVNITLPAANPYAPSLFSRIMSFASLPIVLILIVLVIAVSIYRRIGQ